MPASFPRLLPGDGVWASWLACAWWCHSSWQTGTVSEIHTHAQLYVQKIQTSKCILLFCKKKKKKSCLLPVIWFIFFLAFSSALRRWCKFFFLAVPDVWWIILFIWTKRKTSKHPKSSYLYKWIYTLHSINGSEVISGVTCQKTTMYPQAFYPYPSLTIATCCSVPFQKTYAHCCIKCSIPVSYSMTTVDLLQHVCSLWLSGNTSLFCLLQHVCGLWLAAWPSVPGCLLQHDPRLMTISCNMCQPLSPIACPQFMTISCSKSPASDCLLHNVPNHWLYLVAHLQYQTVLQLIPSLWQSLATCPHCLSPVACLRSLSVSCICAEHPSTILM